MVAPFDPSKVQPTQSLLLPVLYQDFKFRFAKFQNKIALEIEAKLFALSKPKPNLTKQNRAATVRPLLTIAIFTLGKSC
jgi:hypothetical protein